ncbi:hypothetical protein ACFWA9_38600, partial [Kitasatospora sp. NPDC059973]|uniref:hypothetical protein n=1 Tax=Kitasatospora sp. NPDC059973 TaxID=3347020 RepID=UPI0036AF5C22
AEPKGSAGPFGCGAVDGRPLKVLALLLLSSTTMISPLEPGEPPPRPSPSVSPPVTRARPSG